MDRLKEERHGLTQNRIIGVVTDLLSEKFQLWLFRELTERFTCVQVQVYTGVAVDTSDNEKQM